MINYLSPFHSIFDTLFFMFKSFVCIKEQMVDKFTLLVNLENKKVQEKIVKKEIQEKQTESN
jgi:hypothetical protein